MNIKVGRPDKDQVTTIIHCILKELLYDMHHRVYSVSTTGTFTTVVNTTVVGCKSDNSLTPLITIAYQNLFL